MLQAYAFGEWRAGCGHATNRWGGRLYGYEPRDRRAGATPDYETEVTMLSHRSPLIRTAPVVLALGTSWACTGGSSSADSQPSRAAPAIVSRTTSAPSSRVAPASPSVVPTTQASADNSLGVYADCTSPAPEQHPTVQPTEIVLACADDGFGIRDVRWSSWTTRGASGSGTTWYKDCRPSCAEGKIVYTPNVRIVLTTPVQNADGALVWSQITFSALPPGYSPGPQRLPIPHA
jgi:hypothetical protein